MSTDNLADVHTDIPRFRFIRKLIDARQMNERHGYPEGDVKLCYPTVLEAGRHLPDAMARYYMYSSPHDHRLGCGIGMWTADKVEGPWEFRGRVIGKSQAVPSVVYNKERKKRGSLPSA